MATPQRSLKPKTDFAELRGLFRHFAPIDGTALQTCVDSAGDMKYPDHFGHRMSWVAGVQGRAIPKCAHPRLCSFSGAIESGSGTAISNAKRWMTAAMAGKNHLQYGCAAADCDWRIYDMGIDYPAQLPPVPIDEATIAEAVAYGMMAVEQGIDSLILQLAGDGHAAAAEWMQKIPADDGLEILRHMGSRDLAGLFGAVLAARMARVPVFLHGVAAVAVAILARPHPGLLDHCWAVLDYGQKFAVEDFGGRAINLPDAPFAVFSLITDLRAFALHQSAAKDVTFA